MAAIRCSQFVVGKIVNLRKDKTGHRDYSVVANTQDLDAEHMRNLYSEMSIGTNYGFDELGERGAYYLGSSPWDRGMVLAHYMNSPEPEPPGRRFEMVHFVLLGSAEFVTISDCVLRVLVPEITTPIYKTYESRETLAPVVISYDTPSPHERLALVERYCHDKDSWDRVLAILDGILSTRYASVTIKGFEGNLEDKVALVQALYTLLPRFYRAHLSFATSVFYKPDLCKARLKFLGTNRVLDEPYRQWNYIVDWSTGKVSLRGTEHHPYSAYICRVAGWGPGYLATLIEVMHSQLTVPIAERGDQLLSERELLREARSAAGASMLAREVEETPLPVEEVLDVLGVETFAIDTDSLKKIAIGVAGQALEVEPDNIETAAEFVSRNLLRLDTSDFWQLLKDKMVSANKQSTLSFLQACMREEQFRTSSGGPSFVDDCVQDLVSRLSSTDYREAFSIIAHCVSQGLIEDVVAGGLYLVGLRSHPRLDALKEVVRSDYLSNHPQELRRIVADSGVAGQLLSKYPKTCELLRYLAGDLPSLPDPDDTVPRLSEEVGRDYGFIVSLARLALSLRKYGLFSIPLWINISHVEKGELDHLLNSVSEPIHLQEMSPSARGGAAFLAMRSDLADLAAFVPGERTPDTQLDEYAKGFSAVAEQESDPMPVFKAFIRSLEPSLVRRTCLELLKDIGRLDVKEALLQWVVQRSQPEELQIHQQHDYPLRLLAHWGELPSKDPEIRDQIVARMLEIPVRLRDGRQVAELVHSIREQAVNDDVIAESLVSAFDLERIDGSERIICWMRIVGHLASDLSREALQPYVGALEAHPELLRSLAEADLQDLLDMGATGAVKHELARRLLDQCKMEDFVRLIGGKGDQLGELRFKSLLRDSWSPKTVSDVWDFVERLERAKLPHLARSAERILLRGEITCPSSVFLAYVTDLLQALNAALGGLGFVDFDKLKRELVRPNVYRGEILTLCKRAYQSIEGTGLGYEESLPVVVLLDHIVLSLDAGAISEFNGAAKKKRLGRFRDMRHRIVGKWRARRDGYSPNAG